MLQSRTINSNSFPYTEIFSTQKKTIFCSLPPWRQLLVPLTGNEDLLTFCMLGTTKQIWVMVATTKPTIGMERTTKLTFGWLGITKLTRGMMGTTKTTLRMLGTTKQIWVMVGTTKPMDGWMVGTT